MKKILFLNLVLLSTIAFAQKKQNIYYLKYNGAEVQKDSADFTRIIQEPDSGEVNFVLLEYYPDDQKKLIGHVSKFDPRLIYEGQIITFYPNGKKQDIITYENGERIGKAYFFYKNGQMQKVTEYFPGAARPSAGKYSPDSQKMISYFDSTGTELVKEGNGYVKYLNDKQGIIEEGAYANGVKDGTWKGKLGKNTYEEVYENGTFVNGKAALEDGSVNSYKDPEQMPGFKGGLQAFYNFVGRNYRYPPEAKEAGIRGRLILGFVVEKDGSLSNIKLLKDIGGGTGPEAIKLLKKSPDWIPGMQHGIPVRVQYTLPIMLNF